MPTIDNADARRLEWKAHWPLVLAASVGMSFASVVSPAIGLFIQPLAHDFGWGRMAISVGLIISATGTVVLSPLIGALVDRFGSRRIALPGIVGMAVATAAFGLASGSLAQWFALWAIFALLHVFCSTMIWTTAISNAFHAARSMALAAMLTGTAVASGCVPPLTQWLIARFGWRSAFFALGFGWGAIALVVVALLFFDKRSGSVPGLPPSGFGEATGQPALTLGRALRDPSLIRIGIMTLLCTFFGVGLTVHQVPIMSDLGISRAMAALLTGFVGGLAAIIGKLGTGWLLGKFNPGKVGGLTILVSAIAYVLFLRQVGTPPVVAIAIFIVGYTYGATLQLCAFLTALYGGVQNYGKIFGVMSSLIALGGGSGPAVAGAAYDAFGSYDAFLYAACAGTLLAGAILLGLPTPPAARSAAAEEHDAMLSAALEGVAEAAA